MPLYRCFVRDGRLIGRNISICPYPPPRRTDRYSNSFVKQFYAGTPFIPHEIQVQEELEDAEVIVSFLTARRGQKVK